MSYSVVIILMTVCGGARADNPSAKALGLTIPQTIILSADEVTGV
ncbi:MAG: hypothetical protein WBG18_08340 [Xanthobacteraceae bacterium]